MVDKLVAFREIRSNVVNMSRGLKITAFIGLAFEAIGIFALLMAPIPNDVIRGYFFDGWVLGMFLITLVFARTILSK